MNKILATKLWLTFLFFWGAGAQITHAQKIVESGPIPIDVISSYPSLSNVTISEDGSYLVALVADDKAKRQSLAVWNLNDLSAPPKLSKPNGDVEFIFAEALKAGKILVVARTKWTGALAGCGEGKRIGSTKTYLTKIFITDTNFSDFSEPFEKSGSKRDMSEFERICGEMVGTAQIAADLPLDPENVIVSSQSGVFDRKVDYIKYNLRSGDAEVLFTDRDSDAIGLLDRRSAEVLTKQRFDFSDGAFREQIMFKTDTGEFTVHDAMTSNSSDRHNVFVQAKKEGTSKYYVATDQFSNFIEIYEYDVATKSYSEQPIFSHPQFNIGGIILSNRPDNFGTVLGYSVNAARPYREWVDPRFSDIQNLFESSFPNSYVDITDWTSDESSFIISVQGDGTPPSYFIHKEGEGAKLLGASRPKLAKYNLNKTELVYYEARDGMKIPALLDMPKNWKKGDNPPPAIIHPHGGPWARDNAGWDASGWVPFLTSRGYAVLRPQYRGSDGWGRELWLAGDAEWGLKMQDDKDDGAAWMVSNGFADPNKLAIFGYSYGGFAAFAASVRKDSPYQCAIAGAGVSDLTKLGRLWSGNRRQRAYQGKTVKGMDPLAEVGNVNIPVLVIHGDRDVRVPLFHGKDFYNKSRRKVNSKMVVVKDMPHSLPWTPDMQKQMLKEIDGFLNKTCFK